MNRESKGQVHRWRAFAVLAVSYFMTIIDLTIVNVALPTIGRDLHFSESNLQWVVTAYGLTFGGFLLLGGSRRGSARAATDPHGRSGHLHGRLARRRAGE
jgi:MFS family permease